jgi:hypothetical protein
LLRMQTPKPTSAVVAPMIPKRSNLLGDRPPNSIGQIVKDFSPATAPEVVKLEKSTETKAAAIESQRVREDSIQAVLHRLEHALCGGAAPVAKLPGFLSRLGKR